MPQVSTLNIALKGRRATAMNWPMSCNSDERSFLCHMINKASSILTPFWKIRLTREVNKLLAESMRRSGTFP